MWTLQVATTFVTSVVLVSAGHVAGIHVLVPSRLKTYLAGRSPAMTSLKDVADAAYFSPPAGLA